MTDILRNNPGILRYGISCEKGNFDGVTDI